MKKTKKSYETAVQIQDEINRAKDKAIQCILESEQLDSEAKRLARKNDPRLAEAIGFRRSQADKLRVKARRLHEIRIPYLSQKLAEWMTDPLPGVLPTNDRSVQA